MAVKEINRDQKASNNTNFFKNIFCVFHCEVSKRAIKNFDL